MANIDRADWHYQGQFPRDLPPESAATHIGMYLTWLIFNDLISKYGLRLFAERLEELRNRRITGRDLVLNELDEKLFDRLLTKTGRAFTEDYYSGQSYLVDYEACLAQDLPSLYHVSDTWTNFDRLAPLISARYVRWQSGDKPPQPQPRVVEEAAQERYIRAVSQAARLLRDAPQEAVAVLERYCSEEASETFKAMAARELEVLRRKTR